MKKFFSEFDFKVVNRVYQFFLEKRKFTTKYSFVDRSSGAENLLIVVVGYQPFYWEKVFSKIKRAIDRFEEKIDICITNPGGNGYDALLKMTQKYGWSYLHCKYDRLSQAQNQAIKLHEHAKYIFKIDEDIILPENYFAGLKKAYVDSPNRYDRTLGFVAPLINLNGYGYDVFLKTLDVKDEFEMRFGHQVFSENFMNDPIHKNSEMAIWIWNKTLPFDAVATTIQAKNKGKRGLCTFRFSVGAVLFDRSFWKQIGFFDVKFEQAMGLEEEQMNAYCMNHFRSIIIAEDVLVGHLGFGPQKESVKKFFLANEQYIYKHKTIMI